MTCDSSVDGGGGKWPLARPANANTAQLLAVKLLAVNMLSENRQRGFSGGEADFGGLGEF